MSPKHFWTELKSSEFAELDHHSTVTILPVAATEQHGPHLPVMTDTAIAEGMIKTVLARLPDDLRVLFMPVQAIGKSNEHLRSPGTITYSAENLIRIWVEIGDAVHRAGLRKLVIVNSHGGNVDVVGIVARELRVGLGMLVATTQWRRFGLPGNVYSAFDANYGIHAGDIETSLMLAFRRDLVHMDKARDFVSAAVAMEQEFSHLSAAGTHAFGWIAQDLNADGAVGNAALASAEKGTRTAAHQVDGFVGLLRDMRDFSLSRLHAPAAQTNI
jgi:creatinine amidohydrolase